jgi:glycosyltransferase involved in cell wall biosynthesis
MRAAVEEFEGVAIRRVPAWPRDRDYLFAPGVYRLASQPDWDLIHIQSWHTAVPPLAMLAALRAGTPYVVTPHGGHASPPRRPFRPAQRRALTPLLRRARAVIALTGTQQAELLHVLKLQPERMHLIPNGSDLVEQLDPAAVSRIRASFGRPVLVSPGRLEHFKGHHRAIEALPHILRAYPDATLRIFGEGPYESALLRQAGELGVADRVRIDFFPQDRRPELAAALAAADVGILLSEYETQPVAMLELAGLGVPAVVADTPGLRELTVDGLARSVPLDAPPEDVARAVIEALEQPHIEARPLPSWQTVTDELLHVYREVLDGGRSA